MVFGRILSLPGWRGRADPPQEGAANTAAQPAGNTQSFPSNTTGTSLTVNEFVARTKRCKEKGLEPTKPELYAYARYLGIDPFADGDLMWIVDEALKAPLPAEWTEHHDGADRVFYFNCLTHTSSWTHPLEQLHRDTYKGIVSFRNGGMPKHEQNIELDKRQRKCEELEQETHKELQAWSEHIDEDGQTFFFNRDRQRSFWTDPRIAPCHTLYLQMKVLRVLGEAVGRKWAEPLPTDLSRRLKLDGEGGCVNQLTPSKAKEKGSNKIPLSARSTEAKEKGSHLIPLSARSTEAPTLSARSMEPRVVSGAEESGNESASPEKQHKKKKKKKKRQDEENERRELLDWEEHRASSQGPRIASAVEDDNAVRAPHGLSPRHLPPMHRSRVGAQGGGVAPAPSDEDGRAKVRAGIKLMPLS